MKQTIILILTTLIFRTTSAQIKTLSINSNGSYLFNYAGYSFDDPYNQLGLGVSYDYLKQKNGISLNLFVNQNYQGRRRSNVTPRLNGRESVHLSLSYLRNLVNFKNGQLNALIGVATKYSNETIIIGIIDKGSFSEALLDQNTTEFGGIATNLGINSKYFIGRRFLVNASVRSINFLYGASYQKHGIYTELGVGWQLGKLK